VSWESYTEPPSTPALRIKAIEQLLLEKGLLPPGAVDKIVNVFEHRLGPKIGARIVARAWTDAGYKERLLANAPDAIGEFGGSDDPHMAMIERTPTIVLENSPAVHNVVVCTLCSCYPWHVLGLPPNWYKSAPYRSRVVIEPRSVLAEFGLHVPEEVEVRVWDSNNELRYFVLPERPKGTEGWTEERLASIVTRDSMIGAAICKAE
jgi:nitrile hydratase subunit alpha